MKIDLTTWSDLIQDPEFQFCVLFCAMVLMWVFALALVAIDHFSRVRLQRSPVDRLLRETNAARRLKARKPFAIRGLPGRSFGEAGRPHP